MQYQIDNFKVLVSQDQNLTLLVKNKYHLADCKVTILARSIDARKKEAVYYNYRLLIETNKIVNNQKFKSYVPVLRELKYSKWNKEYQPIIVGFGPAGIFASLYLARSGAKPIIIERGSKIEERIKDVEKFILTKELNPNSNVQFGEGGAGAFSDGKLTTNGKNKLNNFILYELYKHGANEDILYDSMPHIGTDVLREVVKNIRLEIISLGGEFHFNTQFLNAYHEKDLVNIETTNGNFKTKFLILGIGHSAKDTIRHLYSQMALKMEPKAFSMGVRIEHLASKIDEAQYGSFAKYLPHAYYKLSYHHNERGIYTFCMCPGGYVLASAADKETIVTNGMSNNKRDGLNSNSALLVDVRPSDYGKAVLDGLDYQEKYERLAYQIGKDYRAPANLVKEFLEGKIAKTERSIKTTYQHGLIMTDLNNCLPAFVVDGLKVGLNEFQKKINGFADPDAILVGIESRSSSPVRILRDENREASFKGLYPIGEGAGYAGGIMSAALDGLLTAIKIAEGKEENDKN